MSEAASTTAITVNRPSEVPIRARTGPLELEAASVSIVDKASHEAALDVLRRLNGIEKWIRDEVYKAPKKLMHDAHKEMCRAEESMLAPIVKAKALLSSRITTYTAAERRRAEEEAAKRQAEERKAAEARQLQEAVAADNAGDAALADDILNAEPDIPLVIPEAQIAESDGERETWSAELVSMEALVRHVLETQQWELLEPNMKNLNALARALKKAMRIPGVRSVPKTSVVVR